MMNWFIFECSKLWNYTRNYTRNYNEELWYRRIITRNCDTEELQRDPRSERTRLHPSTSSSTPRQCETETNRSSRNLHREPTMFPKLNGDATSTTTKRWTSGIKTPQFVTFLAFFTNFPLFRRNEKCFPSSVFAGCRMMGRSRHWSPTGFSSRKKRSSLWTMYD